MFIQHFSQAAEFTAGDHTLLREILHPAQHNVEVPYSIAHARISSKKASLPHVLKGSEVYYVLSGTGRIHIGKESGELRPGVVAVVPPFVEQYVENTGEQDLVFLCIVNPAWTPDSEFVSRPSLV